MTWLTSGLKEEKASIFWKKGLLLLFSSQGSKTTDLGFSTKEEEGEFFISSSFVARIFFGERPLLDGWKQLEVVEASKIFLRLLLPIAWANAVITAVVASTFIAIKQYEPLCAYESFYQDSLIETTFGAKALVKVS